MRYLVNKVKQEEVGLGTLSALDKVQSFQQGPGQRGVTGAGDGAQPIGADLGTLAVVN